MQKLNFDTSAKKMLNALVEPIGIITIILRNKLKGSYGSLYKTDVPKEIKWTTGIHGNFTFPGLCKITSINKSRSITMLPQNRIVSEFPRIELSVVWLSWMDFREE